MSIQAYSDLYDMIEPYLPGCPLPVIVQQLQWAGREFCKRTLRLTEELTLNAVEDERSYQLQSSYSGGSVKSVKRVRSLTEDDVDNDYDGREIPPDCFEVVKGGASTSDSLKVVCAGVSAAEGTYGAYGSETANGYDVYSDAADAYALFCGFKSDDNAGDVFYLSSMDDYDEWKSSGALPSNCFYLPAPNTAPAGTYYPKGTFSGSCVITAHSDAGYSTLKFADAYKPDESVTGGLIIEVVVEPTIKSEGLPEWFYNEYGDAILAGAFWKLYAMPNQPWSSKRDAIEKRVEFLNECDSAKIDALTLGKNGALSMHIEGYLP